MACQSHGAAAAKEGATFSGLQEISRLAFVPCIAVGLPRLVGEEHVDLCLAANQSMKRIVVRPGAEFVDTDRAVIGRSDRTAISA